MARYLGWIFGGRLFGVAFAGDGSGWPQFRGPGGSGVAQDARNSGVPTEWDTTKNVAWRIDVPGLGWSSPIVWGNRVFLTTAVDAQGTEQPEGGFYLDKDRGGRSEHRWLVLAYDLNTGVRLWERQVHQAVPPRIGALTCEAQHADVAISGP